MYHEGAPAFVLVEVSVMLDLPAVVLYLLFKEGDLLACFVKTEFKGVACNIVEPGTACELLGGVALDDGVGQVDGVKEQNAFFACVESRGIAHAECVDVGSGCGGFADGERLARHGKALLPVGFACVFLRTATTRQ